MRLYPAVLLLLAARLSAAVPPLLQEVAQNWDRERDHWAFTQRVLETKGGGVVEERLERYDPSRGHERRWKLLRVDGRAPTADQIMEWSRRKNRPRKPASKAVGDYVDLEHARVRHEDADTVTFDLPLRRIAAGLVPADKVALLITINRHSREIERAQANIDAPFDVALGLARVIDLDLDLAVPPNETPTDHAATEPGTPQGTASAVVNKFGRRVEYYWSDFTRVNPPPAPAP